jgi:hypothetical protein
MIKSFILFLILTTNCFAYTLNNNFGASFKSSNVKVMIAGNTNCSSAGLTIYELQDLIGPAIDKFWNRVPTSNLRLKFGGFTDAITNINDGHLCAPTDDACITAAGSTVIPPVSEIVIACNTNSLDNFGNGSVLAVTVPNNFSGRSIKGAVILINNSSTIFSTLNRADQIGVIAHEIGHAIGLGHTDEKAALMYYRTVDQRKALGEDDMRGVSYLYPMKVDGFGLLGGCGTISSSSGTPKGGSPFWQMGITLGLMIFLSELRKLFRRSKTRSAA